MEHYDASYVAPGEVGVRRSPSSDPVDRDVSSSPHELPGSEFQTVGEIFSAALNPDRKKPFDIRSVMRAVVDADGPLTERWAGMADAETAVVADARMGGDSVCLIGIESQPVARAGFPPSDGPESYTAGTLFPRSSKKVARAINAASGNRPLVAAVQDAVAAAEREMGETGRVLLRPSGTEPVVRVMVEAATQDEADRVAGSLAQVVKDSLGL